MTDITELAQSHELRNKVNHRLYGALEFQGTSGEHATVTLSIAECKSIIAALDERLTLVEELEKAHQRIASQREYYEGVIADGGKRIAELESHTVKPPVHPTVASEKLDDETLQELIEFRRTTFEYHSKEGNKVQTIIHGVTLAALRELQERRKAAMDSEPVAVVEPSDYVTAAQLVGEGPARKAVHELYEGALRIGDKLYRHAQPAPVEVKGSDELYDVIDDDGNVVLSAISYNEAQTESDGYNGENLYIVRHEAQPAPVVMDDTKLRELFDSWFASDCSFDLSPEASEADNIVWRESYWYVWQRCRAAMLQAGNPAAWWQGLYGEIKGRGQRSTRDFTPDLGMSTEDIIDAINKRHVSDAGNSPVIPDGYVLVPREPTEAMMLHKSGCQHHAWDDPDCAMRQTRRLIWSHMLAAAPQLPGSEPATVPDRWIPVSERMPETDGNYWGWWSESKRQGPVWFIKSELQAQFQSHEITHWMPLPAAPQEVNHG